MIKLCIFDMDGTTVNSINSIAHYANAALANHGYAQIPAERFKTLVGNGATVLVRRMLDEVGGRDEDFDAIRDEYNKTYDDGFLYLAEPYSGICDMLTALKSRGINTAILSNKPDTTAKKISDALFGSDMIDLCIGGREGIALKPDSNGVYEIMNRFGVKREECLFIGDTATDIETARNAEVYSIGVLWGFRGRDELESAGANLLVNTPSEIVAAVDGFLD